MILVEIIISISKNRINNIGGGVVMKTQIKIKDLEYGYLYPDGHFTGVYKKNIKSKIINKNTINVKPIEWVEVWESIGIKCNFPNNKGRLIFNSSLSGSANILNHKNLLEIVVSPLSVSRGSERTKELGIAIQDITFRFDTTYKTWLISTMPGIISTDIEFIDRDYESYNEIKDKTMWGYNNLQIIHHGKD